MSERKHAGESIGENMDNHYHDESMRHYMDAIDADSDLKNTESNEEAVDAAHENKDAGEALQNDMDHITEPSAGENVGESLE